MEGCEGHRLGVMCDGIMAYLMYHNVLRILRWEVQFEMNVMESLQ